VTVFGRVNHLGTKPGPQEYLAKACPLWQVGIEYPAKAGGVNSHIAWHQPMSLVSQCSLNAWQKGMAGRDQRRLTGSS